MELFILETERLRLRPLTLKDAEHLHHLYDTDPEVWKFDPGYARSLDERIELIEHLYSAISNLWFWVLRYRT